MHYLGSLCLPNRLPIAIQLNSSECLCCLLVKRWSVKERLGPLQQRAHSMLQYFFRLQNIIVGPTLKAGKRRSLLSGSRVRLGGN